MITPRQSAAARILLALTQRDLADASGASLRTIETFEAGGAVSDAKRLEIESALVFLGAIFFTATSIVDGVGVSADRIAQITSQRLDAPRKAGRRAD